MGGDWGSELKYAGWDAVIIEGRAPKPVYLAIVDDKVEIRDAAHLWGNGIYRATSAICQEMGPEARVAAIGQAGENMVRLSNIMNSFSHSAGGVGGVFGSKHLKAVAVRGTGPVPIAAGRAAWREVVLVFSIPDELDSEAAAPLLCGGVTAYSPLRSRISGSR
jgi:aldehyde:ferredoxin oxidoreductase